MNGKTFKKWQQEMGWNSTVTAERLGKSQDTIVAYRRDGLPRRDERTVALAMAALSHRLEPYQ